MRMEVGRYRGEVGTCNKAEIRLRREMQVEAAGALQPCG